MDSLSYEEYFKQVDEMICNLKDHWQAEQRVKALKVAIQLSKLLANSSQMRLYAKKFKMITDTLNEFGGLIYDRIQSKATEIPRNIIVVPPTPTSNGSLDGFLESQRELAKETCRNWFLKITSIRELVPRFYSELAILQSCDILLKPTARGLASIEEQFYAQSLRRLTKTAWGFGDPIVAIYARLYLCRVAVRLIGWKSTNSSDPLLFDIILANLKANATLISHLDVSTVLRLVQAQNVDIMVFFDLISSALQANVGCVVVETDEEDDATGETTGENEQQREQSERQRLMLNCLIHRIEGNGKRGERKSEEKPTANMTTTTEMASTRQWDKVASSACSILSCNILLHAAFRSLNADVVAANGQRLSRLIQLKVMPKWRSFRQLANGTNQSETHGQNQTLTGASGTHQTFADVQSITQTLYQALGAFAVALDASERLTLELGQNVAECSNEERFVSVTLDDDRDYDDDELGFGGNQEVQRGSANLPLAQRILVAMDDAIEEVLKFELDHIDPLLSSHYLRCFTSWFSFANHYGQAQEIDKLLGRFVARIGSKRQFVAHYKVLIDLIKILFTNRKNLDEFAGVLRLKSFNQLFDLLRRDDYKLEASKWILETMRANLKLHRPKAKGLRGETNNEIDSNASSNINSERITNKETVSFLLKLFTTINDSLSLLAIDDDIDHLAEIIIYFLDRIQTTNHREQLNFFSKCRGSMGNLNPILVYLCRRVLKMAQEFRSMERKRSAKQDYLNGCLAFTYVTIPAINDPYTRFDLLLEGSQLALKHMSLSLADYYMKQIFATLTGQLESMTVIKREQEQANNNRLSIVSKYLNDPTESIRAFGAKTENANSIIKSNPMACNDKRLADQVFSLLRLILKFEDHIDLKHKLILARVIRCHFSEHPNLIENLEHLNVISDEIDHHDDYMTLDSNNRNSNRTNDTSNNNDNDIHNPGHATSDHMTTEKLEQVDEMNLGRSNGATAARTSTTSSITISS